MPGADRPVQVISSRSPHLPVQRRLGERGRLSTASGSLFRLTEPGDRLKPLNLFSSVIWRFRIVPPPPTVGQEHRLAQTRNRLHPATPIQGIQAPAGCGLVRLNPQPGPCPSQRNKASVKCLSISSALSFHECTNARLAVLVVKLTSPVPIPSRSPARCDASSKGK